MTYVPTWAGFIYLAVVMDVFSHKVVGWAFGERMTSNLVIAALNMALVTRRPETVIHRSDQYTSVAFGKRCQEMGVKPSMVTVGDVYEQISGNSGRLRLFAQLADKEKSEKAGYQVPSNKVVKVLNSNSWPENTVTSYVVLMRENGTIAAFQQAPIGASGDWFNTYTHYYDGEGNTLAFKRYSSFFNGCPSSPSNETSTYYYQEHKLIAKDYSLKGENDKTLDQENANSCIGMATQFIKTWAGSKKASAIGQAW